MGLLGNLGFFGTDNPVLYFVGRLITCPVACALLLCAWVLQKMLGRPKPFNTVLNQCGVMIFAFFLSITRATLIPFQCVQNPNGTSSMMLHPGIICYWVLVEAFHTYIYIYTYTHMCIHLPVYTRTYSHFYTHFHFVSTMASPIKFLELTPKKPWVFYSVEPLIGL